MKIICSVLLSLIASISIAQNNNELELLKKYSSYKLIKNQKSKYDNWTYKFELDNGKIISQECYERKTLASISKFSYDTINNIQYGIKLYDRDDGYKIDTVNVEQKIYNNKKELVQTLFSREPYNRFSNFNENGLPQTEEFEDPVFYSKIEYKYNSNNNMIEEKLYSKYFDEKNHKETDSLQTETITYQYDSHNNVIELNRKFKFPEKFPIIYGGGKSNYENEKFRYIYNKDGLWIKKYWIVNEKEFFIEKRKFISKN